MLKLAVVLVGDVNTAEDIVHDVFVKFAQSADRINAIVVMTDGRENYSNISLSRLADYMRRGNETGDCGVQRPRRPNDLDGRTHDCAAAGRQPVHRLCPARNRLHPGLVDRGRRRSAGARWHRIHP